MVFKFIGISTRKALTPNDFVSIDEPALRLRSFERHYEAIAKPFQ